MRSDIRRGACEETKNTFWNILSVGVCSKRENRHSSQMARVVENELTHGVAPDGSRRYVLACNEGALALNNIRQQFVASNPGQP